MNDQDIIRPKRGSWLLLVSVIAQWFLSLSKDFSSFLSPVVFGTIFVLSITSLSNAGWCNSVHMHVSARSGHHFLGTGPQPYSFGQED